MPGIVFAGQQGHDKGGGYTFALCPFAFVTAWLKRFGHQNGKV